MVHYLCASFCLFYFDTCDCFCYLVAITRISRPSLDNSEWMRNGDYIPTRMEAQHDAANLLCGSKTQANPESTVSETLKCLCRRSVIILIDSWLLLVCLCAWVYLPCYWRQEGYIQHFLRSLTCKFDWSQYVTAFNIYTFSVLFSLVTFVRDPRLHDILNDSRQQNIVRVDAWSSQTSTGFQRHSNHSTVLGAITNPVRGHVVKRLI